MTALTALLGGLGVIMGFRALVPGTFIVLVIPSLGVPAYIALVATGCAWSATGLMLAADASLHRLAVSGESDALLPAVDVPVSDRAVSGSVNAPLAPIAHTVPPLPTGLSTLPGAPSQPPYGYYAATGNLKLAGPGSWTSQAGATDHYSIGSGSMYGLPNNVQDDTGGY